MKKYLILVILWKISYYNLSAQSNSDSIINSYSRAIYWDSCSNYLQVDSTAGLKIGDTILLFQTKGAYVDTSNTAKFGDLISINNTGNYEFNRIYNISGNKLYLTYRIERKYDLKTGIVQVITVPIFDNYTINSKLSCKRWNGNTGGVLVFKVRQTLTLKSNIDVSGKGFAGGRAVNKYNTQKCNYNDYYYPNKSIYAVAKGESISQLSNFKLWGKGKNASGGGGGNEHNSGGGGGGNGGAGGKGGYQLYECNYSIFDNRGIGGINYNYSNTDNKIFFGGGGGAGHCNNGYISPPLVLNSDGGNGGGIVLIESDNIVTNGNNINSNGYYGFEINSSATYTHEGMGGGGAGGTILLQVNNVYGNLNINLKGGKGANVVASYTYGTIGPGGGGGGGTLWINKSQANFNINQTGGASGVLITKNNDKYGSEDGKNGVLLNGLKLTFPSKKTKSLIINKSANKNICLSDSVLYLADKNYMSLTITPNLDYIKRNKDTFIFKPSKTQIYTFKIIDSNNCNYLDTLNVKVKICCKIKSDFKIRDTIICNFLDSVKIINTSIGLSNVKYSWYLNNNLFSKSKNPTSFLINQNNIYNIKLKVTNDTCTDSTTKQVVAAMISANKLKDTIICSYVDSINLGEKSLTGFKYEWFPKNIIKFPTISPTFIKVKKQEKIIWVKTHIQTGCFVSDTLTVNKNTPPNKIAIKNKCEKDTAFFNFGPTYSIIGLSPSIYSQKTKYFLKIWSPISVKYIIKITDSNNCQYTDTAKISVINCCSAKASIFVSDTVKCSITDSIAVFNMSTSNGKFISSWEFKPNFFIQNINSNPFFIYPRIPGVYTIKLTIDNDTCIDSVSKKITILDLKLNLNNDTNFCEDKISPIILGNNTDKSLKYMWSPNLWLSNFTQMNPVANVKKTQKYVLQASDSNNLCKITDSIQIVVNQKPNAKFVIKPSSQLLVNETGELIPQQNDLYHAWFVNDSQIYNPFFMVKSFNSSTIKHIIKNPLTGCTDTQYVVIKPVDEKIYIPNAFTPDETNLNDYFHPFIYNITEYNIKIYSRWGEKLYESSDLKKGWNGVYNNKNCQEGVYVYLINCTGLSGKKYKFTGTFHLLR